MIFIKHFLIAHARRRVTASNLTQRRSIVTGAIAFDWITTHTSRLVEHACIGHVHTYAHQTEIFGISAIFIARTTCALFWNECARAVSERDVVVRARSTCTWWIEHGPVIGRAIDVCYVTTTRKALHRSRALVRDHVAFACRDGARVHVFVERVTHKLANIHDHAHARPAVAHLTEFARVGRICALFRALTRTIEFDGGIACTRLRWRCVAKTIDA